MILIELPDEAATAALAVCVAALSRPGDVIALKGELGAGKTSFTRAFIRARGGVEAVPSPTFTLVQVYELDRGTIWHIDGYRLRHPEEAWELDIEDAFCEGISLIEWPERLGSLVPARRLEITLSAGPTPAARRAALDPGAEWSARLTGLAASMFCHPRESAIERETAIADFLAASGWDGVTPASLAGDASFRRYYRLADGARRVVLMDAPPLLEDVRPYVAVADILRRLGLSAPHIHAEDGERGFLLIEDFGDDSYTRLLAAGADEAALYALAVDTLVALHRAVAAARGLPALPPYDEARLLGEAELLLDWYAPEALGMALPPAAREDYRARWRDILPQASLPETTLVLRDYHVDNLMLLPNRAGVAACGLLDFQDAVLGPASYDLVSLLEDARRDVPADLRAAMTERYLAAFPRHDRALFMRSGAILAVQRNCKILGIFTRLWRRDGKPAYLPHIARIWRLIEADVSREPALRSIADWLDRHLPRRARRAPLGQGRETSAA
jgi:tRNA threonylcarbamoyl adenosine modification protein YjeE